MGEGFNDDTPAWRGIVDAHLDSITKLETLIDVKGAVNQFAATQRGLPDDVIADIEAAENNALMRFSTAAAGWGSTARGRGAPTKIGHGSRRERGGPSSE